MARCRFCDTRFNDLIPLDLFFVMVCDGCLLAAGVLPPTKRRRIRCSSPAATEGSPAAPLVPIGARNKLLEGRIFGAHGGRTALAGVFSCLGRYVASREGPGWTPVSGLRPRLFGSARRDLNRGPPGRNRETNYSWRNATIGFMRTARRAGI